MRAWVARALKVIAGAVGVRELFLVAAAGLLGWGFWLIWPPLGFIVPGLLLAFIAVHGVN